MDSRIAARVSSEEMDALQYMVDRGMFGSFSEAVSTAISELISSRLTDDERVAATGCYAVEGVDIVPKMPVSEIHSVVCKHLGVDDDQ